MSLNGVFTKVNEVLTAAAIGLLQSGSLTDQEIQGDSGNRLDTQQDRIQLVADGSDPRIRDRGRAAQFGSRASNRNLGLAVASVLLQEGASRMDPPDSEQWPRRNAVPRPGWCSCTF